MLRCLVKERDRRFGRVEELASALREALSREEQPSPRALTPPPHLRLEHPAPRRRTVAVLFFRSGATPVTLQKVLASFGGHRPSTKTAGSPACSSRTRVTSPCSTPCAPRRDSWPRSWRRPRCWICCPWWSSRAPVVHRATWAMPSPGTNPSSGRTLPLLLLTRAAVDALPEKQCVPVPERPGLFRIATLAVAPQDVTDLCPESGTLVGRDEELAELERSARRPSGNRCPRSSPCWGTGATARATWAPPSSNGSRSSCPTRSSIPGGPGNPSRAAWRARCAG
ncbi:hypothetical protein ACN28S_41945 [Cystobacter fuscus]